MALTYRKNAEAGAALAAEAEATGVRAAVRPLDLSDADATARFLDEVADRFDGIHTLVYAAGPHVPMVHLSRVTPDRFRQQIEADAIVS